MLKIINPANEMLVCELETTSIEDVIAAFKRAKAAQKAWSIVPLEEKKSMILAFKESLEQDAEQLGAILTSEMGKPLQQAIGEVKAVGSRIQFFLDNVGAALQTEQVLPEQKVDLEQIPPMQENISYEPLGVIANISAWNYPYFVGSNVFIPALLTGNAVLYKPSEFSTLTGLAIGERLHKAGIPKDIFQVLVGRGDIGAALLEQPIDGVFFTGSYPTGKKIAEAVAPKLIKLQLELGGKDPVYVCNDMNPSKIAEGLAGDAFYNAGQSCCAVERIYVHESIFEPFVEAFSKTVKTFKTGDPMEKGNYIGPVTREDQLDFLDRQVADAVQKGAKLLHGGKRIEGAGYFFEPTVLINVDHTMEVMKEESFGPIIGIQSVKDDQEALEKMNDTQFGLTAAIFTNDRARAVELLSQVNSGSVYWNCCDRISPLLPWTGRKNSGLGSTLSHIGIKTFVQPKAWHLRK